eukprot:scaffold28544_cov78-Attheya_sp.AAC.7
MDDEDQFPSINFEGAFFMISSAGICVGTRDSKINLEVAFFMILSRAGIRVGTMDIKVYAVLEGTADSHFDLAKQRQSQTNKKELRAHRHIENIVLY